MTTDTTIYNLTYRSDALDPPPDCLPKSGTIDIAEATARAFGVTVILTDTVDGPQRGIIYGDKLREEIRRLAVAMSRLPGAMATAADVEVEIAASIVEDVQRRRLEVEAAAKGFFGVRDLARMWGGR